MSVIVKVSSDSSNPTHHLSLVVDGTTVGLIVKGFPTGLGQSPYSPSSLQFNVGRQGYGSFEPPYSSIDQVDWSGGFGQLRFKDTSKFYDSYNVWSLTDGTLMPAPAWRFGQELQAVGTGAVVSENSHMPSDKRLSGGGTCLASHVAWQSLTGNDRYRAAQITADVNYDIADSWLLLRYFGSPGTLTVAMYSDDASDAPNAALANGTCALATAKISAAAPEGDMVGQLICFNFATAPSVVATNKYHVVVYGASTDDTDDYWEVAYSDISAGSEYGNTYTKSADGSGSSWTTSDGPIFYRVMAAVKDAKMHFIEYKNGLYACSEPLDGTAGKIYINGDRGVSTGTSSASTLEDTTKSWTTNYFKEGVCHIWNGKGQGQYRKITGQDANTLTIDPDWSITPVQGGTDAGSEYTIIGTPLWRDVTPSGNNAVPAAPITDVLTLWGILYCAMGEEDDLHRFREYNDNGSPGVWTTFWGSNSGTGTFGTSVADEETGNNALFLEKIYDPVNENFIWRARNEAPAEWSGLQQSSVRKADDVTWGTDLDFSAFNTVVTGTRDHLITQITTYNGLLWVGKEDGIWYIDSDGTYDRAHSLQVGLEAMTEPTNCQMMFAKDLYLYFNWGNSVERLFSSTVDDIGPWRGAGMIERARGPISDGIPVIGWEFMAVDGGPEGQSSIIANNGRGWHTLFRAPSKVLSAFSGSNANPRIRSLHWQSVPGKDATNILWFECGGQIMFMRFPRASLNPSQDSNVDLAPESFVVHSEMDAGYAELEKYYGKAKLVCNVVSGELCVDYDTNANPFAFSWTNATRTGSAPSYSYAIGSSRKRNIMLRVRTSTANVAGAAPARGNNIQALVLDTFSRSPVKYRWTVRVDLSDDTKTLTGKLDHDKRTLLNYLKTWSGQGLGIPMRSADPFMDADGSGRTVAIEPPNIFRSVWNKATQKWGGYATVVLVEL